MIYFSSFRFSEEDTYVDLYPDISGIVVTTFSLKYSQLIC